MHKKAAWFVSSTRWRPHAAAWGCPVPRLVSFASALGYRHGASIQERAVLHFQVEAPPGERGVGMTQGRRWGFFLHVVMGEVRPDYPGLRSSLKLRPTGRRTSALGLGGEGLGSQVSAWVGRVMVKSEPRAGSEWTVMVPPCSSTMRRVVARPRPVPSFLVEK
jgi:hypothetical protein